MKSIAIVSKLPMGFRGIPFGADGWFFKRNSSKIRNNLRKRLKERNISCEVYVDNGSGSLAEVKKSGADLILVSPFIRSYADTSELSEQDYYFMREDDYLSGSVERIVGMLARETTANLEVSC